MDCPLPGGTIDRGCFYPVTIQNRSVTVDFGRYQPREEKEEEGEEKLGVTLLFPCSIAGGRRIAHAIRLPSEEEGEEKPGVTLLFLRPIRRPPRFTVPIRTELGTVWYLGIERYT
ncbi:hypothetical protein BHM03_00062772 [Ensete ventricosum]|nr:hypothetical protein BHM03_00062772 [Ensete ventricosum]